MPNNFWLAELTTLQARPASGELEDIQVHQYDSKADTWLLPISLKNAADWDRPPLYRRSANNDNKSSGDIHFKWLGTSAEEQAAATGASAEVSLTQGVADFTGKYAIIHPRAAHNASRCVQGC